MIALLERFPDDDFPELERIRMHCKDGVDGDFGIGAQFMSEMQGGSDIPANRVIALFCRTFFRFYQEQALNGISQAESHHPLEEKRV